jgi:hypothetical protein
LVPTSGVSASGVPVSGVPVSGPTSGKPTSSPSGQPSDPSPDGNRHGVDARHAGPDPPGAPTLPDRGGLVGLGGREASQGPPHLAPADHCGHHRRPGNFWQ